jgi:integrase/recombinase XerC
MLNAWLTEFSATPVPSRTEETQGNYVTKCRAFLRWLGPDPQPSEFTTAAISAFIAGLEGIERRPRTVRSYLTSLRAFGKWLVQTGKVAENPGAAVKAPKLDRPRRKVPTHQDILSMLDAASHMQTEARTRLALAVVATLVYSGARRQELLNLCVDDIDFEQGLIHIRHGKGDKPRDVAPHPDCFAALASYLDGREEVSSSRLFILRGRPMADDGLRSLLRQILAVARLAGNKALLPHGLRHAVATRLHRAGAELDVIREFLGHSSITTTSLYLHSGPERIKEIAPLTAIPAPPPPGPAAPDPAPSPVESPLERPNLRLWREGGELA